MSVSLQILAYTARVFGVHVLVIGHLCLCEKIIAFTFIKNLCIS
jgi:hypothetical protein